MRTLQRWSNAVGTRGTDISSPLRDGRFTIPRKPILAIQYMEINYLLKFYVITSIYSPPPPLLRIIFNTKSLHIHIPHLMTWPSNALG